MEYQHIVEEALSYYSIPKADAILLRHNENMTFRVGEDYLLQIHEHAEGFQTQHIYEGADRMAVYKAELEFLAYLKAQGMTIREPVENCYGGLITRLSDGRTVTVSKWIEGESLDKLELNDERCRQIGTLTANLHRCAKEFQSYAAIAYDAQHCRRIKERFQSLERVGLSAEYSDVLQRTCDAVGISLRELQSEFQIVHADLSPSNILETKNGFVAIDFSMFGMGHPMLDLAVLFGNVRGLVRRQKIAEGYRNAGRILNYEALDACFVLTILDCIAIHFERWSRQEWFEDRMKRWCRESLEPFCRGERLFRDDFYLIHAGG